MSGMALVAMLPLIYASGPRLELDGDHPESRAALCGRWEACQTLFAQAGRAILDGDYALADSWLRCAATQLPDPYRAWAIEGRKSLAAALESNPAQATAADRQVVEPPSFDDLYAGIEPAPRLEVPPLTIDDPFAPVPSRAPGAASLQKPAGNIPFPQPPPVPLPTKTLRLARVCRELRDYRSAADLLWRGIDAGEFSAAQVGNELLECLARDAAPLEELLRLQKLLAEEAYAAWFAVRLSIAAQQRLMLLHPELKPGDPGLEWDTYAGRNYGAGRDRLEYLQRVRPLVKTADERLRFCNAMSQALRQIGDDVACSAWEESLLAEFPDRRGECAAVLERRAERLLAAGDALAATLEFRRAIRLEPWSIRGQRARFRLGLHLQQQGSYAAAIREFERLVPPAMIDGADGEIVECTLGDRGLSASCSLSECYEQLGQFRPALQWAEVALEIENSEGRVRVNWDSRAAERVLTLRQRLAESGRDDRP